jgi:formate hydrogenlyase subunit 3/multisubunit Na+/H+ antiporter MnhD subunit
MTGLWLAAQPSPGRFSFDPGSTLFWSVPLLLILPLVGLVLLLTGARTRRGAAWLAGGTLFLTLLDLALVSWARAGQALPYRSTQQWINVSVAFTGDSRFQGFGVDLSFRVTHVVLAFVCAILLLGMACVSWQRLAGRQEQGPVRTMASVLLFVLGATGALLSADLAELVGFWMVAGAASFFLLGSRWGTEEGGRAAHISLALPFVGDLALLGAVAFLYSRFGATDVDKLLPMYNHTAGVDARAMGMVALLLLGAVMVRGALWPFTAWQTATVDAPPALSALVAAVWPLVAGHLLALNLPLLAAGGFLAPRITGWALAVAAVAGPALALLSFEVRRAALLASSGAVALCFLAIVYPGSAAAGLAGLLALAGGRAALLLAGGWIVPALRTSDLREMGEGLRRMPRTAALLAGGALAVGASAAVGSAGRPPSPAWVALGLGLALVGLALGRLWAVVSLRELPRRRAFEPSRVRDVGESVATAVLVAVGVGVAGAVLSFVPAWTRLLLGAGPSAPAPVSGLAWLLPAAVGVGLGILAQTAAGDRSLALSARVGQVVWSVWTLVGGLWRRLLADAALRLLRAVEIRGLPGIEGRIGRALTSSAVLALRSAWYAPAVLGVAVVIGVVLGAVGLGGPR